MEKTEGKKTNLAGTKISRRALVKSLIGAAALSLSGCNINPLPSGDKPTPESTLTPEEALKTEIETKFNIELLNLRNLWQEAGFEYPDNNPNQNLAYYRDVPKTWDLERLALIKEGLSHLPPHMYASNAEGKKLRLVLSYRNVSDAAYVKEGDQLKLKKDTKSHQVELDHREFKIGSPKEPFEILAHELTHIVTPMTSVVDSYVLDGKTYSYEKFESPWFDTMYEILDRSFFKGQPTPINNRLEQLKKTDVDSERRNFYQNLDYALTNNYDPNEFIGVMGQGYTHGYAYFSSMYGIFFPPETVTKMYNFTRDQIYRGAEFSGFPTRSYRNPS